MAKGATLTGRKVLAILLGSFGAVFAANGLMAYDAVSTFSGEVANNPYEVGLEYNSQIAAADAQSGRHWKVDVTFAGAGVSATFRDARGRPIPGLAVSGVFAAPADMSRDRRFAMREASGGVYVGGEKPASGVWDLKLIAARHGATLFQTKNRVELR